MNWNLPEADQGQSRLLSLPAEIRLNILRNLLVTDETIGERSDYNVVNLRPRRDSNGRFQSPRVTTRRRGYSLNPAVLQTCQLLNIPSELYKENVVRIDITMGSYTGPPATARTVCNADQGCDNCILVTALDDMVMARADCRGNWTNYQDVVPIVNRFQKVLITLRAEASTDSRVAIRQFLNWFNSNSATNHVEVDICYPSYNTGRDFAKYIHLFRLLRCQTFRFVHSHRQNPLHGQVEQEVMSALPINDLMPAMNDLTPMGRTLDREILSGSLPNNARALSRDLHDTMDDLLDAVELFDNNRFRHNARHLLDMFTTQMGNLVTTAYTSAGL